MVELIFILPLSFEVHVARVPVAILGDALRAPMGPNAELGVLVPLRGVVLEQGIPRWLERTSSSEVGDGGFHRHPIPGAARNGQGFGAAPRGSFPGRVIQPFLNDFAIAQFVEGSLVGRQCAEAGVVLDVLVEPGGQIRRVLWRRLTGGWEGSGCGSNRKKSAKITSLHTRSCSEALDRTS